ncbi:hypothetical protein M422DRAFT_239646 [Sphaerobolus stellatus SS14]|nr:hypothetical protein M422DRAFT_239646 [Sphaerobolus stellatus SS14]
MPKLRTLQLPNLAVSCSGQLPIESLIDFVNNGITWDDTLAVLPRLKSFRITSLGREELGITFDGILQLFKHSPSLEDLELNLEKLVVPQTQTSPILLDKLVHLNLRDNAFEIIGRIHAPSLESLCCVVRNTISPTACLDLLSRNINFEKITSVKLQQNYFFPYFFEASAPQSSRPFKIVIKVENITVLQYITSACTALNELYIYARSREDESTKRFRLLMREMVYKLSSFPITTLEMRNTDWTLSEIFDYLGDTSHYPSLEVFTYWNPFDKRSRNLKVITKPVCGFAKERNGKLKAITLGNCGPPLAPKFIKSLKKMGIEYKDYRG